MRRAVTARRTMTQYLTIEGTLPSLNEYIAAERTNRHIAAKMKREMQDRIIAHIREDGLRRIYEPVFIRYLYFEPSRRRDKDNISAIAHKFVQDALVEAGILENDGWKQIKGFSDHFDVSAENPHIFIELEY